MPFEKGKEKTGGRQPGVQNKLTSTVKEVVLRVFNDLQDDEQNNLTAFALKYPKEFYQIAAKLIPMELNAKLEGELSITWKEEKTYEKKLDPSQSDQSNTETSL